MRRITEIYAEYEHFANILYNQQTDQFKFLDPRGNYGGCIGTIGDDIYDWAKLAHDCYWGYNSIVADVPQNKYVKELLRKRNLESILNNQQCNEES